MTDSITLNKVTDEFKIYLNLAQAYEAEFSSITKKQPDQNGLFALDTPIDEEHIAFIPYLNDNPVGLANIRKHPPSNYEVCEFYIVPVYRKMGLGTKVVHTIWRQYPGKWTIKQMQGAEYATQFWRHTIVNYKETQYTEDHYQDPYWGMVTRQLFTV